MKRIKIGYFKFFALSFAVIILIFIIGCSGPAPTEPIINSFSADPSTITEEESSILSWSTTGATSVSIDHTIGSVDLIGTTTISPTVTTTYTLTATNAEGSVTATTIVTVTEEPPTTGSLQINSTPTGASIFLDGIDTGKVTPDTLPEVEPGDHTLKLEKYHYKNYEILASISAGETTEKNIFLTYATEQMKKIQPGNIDGKDTWVYEQNPTFNYGNSINLFVGNFYGYFMRGFLEFNLSLIPEDAVIVSAKLSLYHTKAAIIGGQEFNPVGVYQVLFFWDESSLIWDNQPAYHSSPYDIVEFTDYYQSYQWVVTDLVQNWLNGSFSNYGMMLRCVSNNPSYCSYSFCSSEHATANWRPKLTVYYYIP
jgi:hypothetical protein